MPYRPDIDGLRALAVLAVVITHAAPAALPGGFVGVDIFFVISGFLISGIILSALADGRFTLADFYARRIRRIFPALALVLAATLAYGTLVLLPQERALLGRDAAAGAAFVANLAFWAEVGYFDRGAAAKPLLHLWSLGVEEQFYILWPLLLAAMHRWGGVRTPVLAALAVASFIASVALLATHPSAAFYSPATRLWELAAGAILACATRRGWQPGRWADAASLAGLALLLAPLALLHNTMPFPGWLALPPVLGTVLLIATGPTALINRTILAARPAVAIGLISYPLYLWHWPLLSYAHIIHQGRPLKPLLVAALLAASLALAWATWRFVERPIRAGRHPRATPALAAAMLAIAAAGLALWQHSSAASPAADIARINAAIGDGVFRPTPAMRVRETAGKFEATITPPPTTTPTPGLLLVGDSLLFHYGPRVQAVAESGRLAVPVTFVVGPSCAPFPGTIRPPPFTHCTDLATMTRAVLNHTPIATVLLGAFWAGHTAPPAQVEIAGRPAPIDSPAAIDAVFTHLETEVTRLRRLGLRVILLLSPPTHPRFDPRQMVTRTWHGYRITPNLTDPVPLAPLQAARATIDARLQAIAARTGAETRDPLPDICGPGPGCTPFTPDGTPKFADDKHLRPTFVAANITFLDDLLTR